MLSTSDNLPATCLCVTLPQPLGMRAVVISNVNSTEFSGEELEENKETWLYYPDLDPGWDEKVGRTSHMKIFGATAMPCSDEELRCTSYSARLHMCIIQCLTGCSGSRRSVLRHPHMFQISNPKISTLYRVISVVDGFMRCRHTTRGTKEPRWRRCLRTGEIQLLFCARSGA